MHLTNEVLAPIRARYGEPTVLEWAGEISEREWGVATYDPKRTHDVTLFILNGPRLALIRRATNVITTWPRLYLGYRLETTTALGTNHWDVLTNVITTLDEFRSTNAISGPTRFFRLSL